MRSTGKLTETITDLLDHRGSWLLSRDEILSLLEMDIIEAYPLIVKSSDPLVDFAVAEYGRENTGVLINLLECLGFTGAAEDFWHAGLWIPYSIQIELQESLVQVISGAVGQHQFDTDTFISMFDNFSRFIRSANCYIEEFFSKDDLVDTAIGKLLDGHPETVFESAGLSLKLLAGELLRRDIIPYRDFFTRLFIKMKACLIATGRIVPEAEKRSQAEGRGSLEEKREWKERVSACKLFGYRLDQHVDRQELKNKYKQLMKEYHPDLNPKGLEMSKKINLAYGILVNTREQIGI